MPITQIDSAARNYATTKWQSITTGTGCLSNYTILDQRTYHESTIFVRSKEPMLTSNTEQQIEGYNNLDLCLFKALDDILPTTRGVLPHINIAHPAKN